jgi:hypothetical protein
MLPGDIGINHPTKNEMDEQWEELILNGGGVEGRVAKMPSRRQVAEWIIGTYDAIMQTHETAQNAWRKMGYEWLLG